MEAKITTQQLEPICRATGDEDLKIPSVPKRNRFPHAQLIMCLNYAFAHFFAIVGLVFICQGSVKLSTIISVEIFSMLSGFGITVGAHRLFAHRSFKAKTPLKILVTILFTFVGQHSIWLWAAWHRVHHKFSDTDNDPHNSRRGFFYSHIGWLLIYDHEAFLENLKKVDMSDLEKEPTQSQETCRIAYVETIRKIYQICGRYLTPESLGIPYKSMDGYPILVPEFQSSFL